MYCSLWFPLLSPCPKVLENFKPQTRVIVLTVRANLFVASGSWCHAGFNEDAGHEVAVLDLSQERWPTSQQGPHLPGSRSSQKER